MPVLTTSAVASATAPAVGQWLIPALGVLAAVITLVSNAVYAHRTLHGHVQPERASWWIWTLQTLVALLAQWQAGGRWSVTATASGLFGIAVIAVMSLWYGHGTFTRSHARAIALAAAGAALWWVTDEPWTALAVLIFVDLSALLRTIVKTIAAPHSESLSAWALTVVAAACSVAAALLGGDTWQVLLWPVFMLSANTGMTLVIIHQQARRRPSLPGSLSG